MYDKLLIVGVGRAFVNKFNTNQSAKVFLIINYFLYIACLSYLPLINPLV